MDVLPFVASQFIMQYKTILKCFPLIQNNTCQPNKEMYWVHVTFSCTYIAFSKSLKKDGVSRSSSSESSKSMSRSLCRSSENRIQNR